MSVTSPPVVSTVADSAMDDKEQIGRAIGRIASGVFIVTVDNGGKRDGLMASWVCQAAFEPPMLTVAIKSDRHFLAALAEGSRFTVNVLSKANMDIFKNFARPYSPGLDRFDGLSLSPGTKAGPVLSDSVAYLDCLVRRLVPAGDHTLVLAEIFHGGPLKDDHEPMVHLRTSGFKY